eukprot:4446077-Alexandrium_andersonii.AAC.1
MNCKHRFLNLGPLVSNHVLVDLCAKFVHWVPPGSAGSRRVPPGRKCFDGSVWGTSRPPGSGWA